MFDFIEVRKDNQDMSIAVLVENYKDIKTAQAMYIRYSDDMTEADKNAFTARLRQEVHEAMNKR